MPVRVMNALSLVKGPNCLIKTLHKKESLPQIRNLHEKITQLSSVNQEAGGRNEVNDEGKEATNGCNGP